MIDILTNDYRQPVIPPQYSFVELDMGCGRGKFTLELAKRFPDRLILASDVMLGRLRKLDLKVEKRHLANVILLRAESGQLAEFQLSPHSIDRLHILCPDPWPKDKGKGRRTVCTAFLCSLTRVLKPGGILHLSTDNAPYFEDWRKMLAALPFFAPAPDALQDIADIKTDFELQWLAEGTPVQHLAYKLVARACGE